MPTPHPKLDPEAASLLTDLVSCDGLDFASYQPASLLRRLAWRMTTLGVAGYAAYREYLAAHPDERRLLCEAVPVHRTEFFRDPVVWSVLAGEVLPRVLREAGAGGVIRVWSAGCATGEEAYTLAVLLAEAAGPDAALRERVRVFGTDVSGAAIGRARAGRYRTEFAAPIPPAARDRYFLADGAHVIVRPELRRMVAFARHDLLRDPPLRKMHLVACRNTLMYFTTVAQLRVLAGLDRALVPGGVLVVGRLEAPHIWCDLFRPEVLGARIFRKSVPDRSGRRPVGLAGRLGPARTGAANADG